MSSARIGAAEAPSGGLIGAERPDLQRHEMRRRPLRHDVGRQLSLEHRPDTDDLAAAGALHSRHVGDERPVETGGQLRRKVASLIRVRQHDHGRVEQREGLLQRGRVAVGRVRLERVAVDGDDLLHRGRAEFGRRRIDV